MVILTSYTFDSPNFLTALLDVVLINVASVGHILCYLTDLFKYLHNFSKINVLVYVLKFTFYVIECDTFCDVCDLDFLVALIPVKFHKRMYFFIFFSKFYIEN